MTTLALQIFLLLLSAFLAGCVLGCLLRRAFYASRYDRTERDRVTQTAAQTAVQTAVPVPAPARPVRAPSPEAARFERALTGGSATAAAAARQEPVVEVRPKPPVPVAPQIETVVVKPVDVPKAPSAPAPAPVAPPPAPLVQAAPAPVVLKPVEPAALPLPPAPPAVEVQSSTATAAAAAAAAAMTRSTAAATAAVVPPPAPPVAIEPPKPDTAASPAIAAAADPAATAASLGPPDDLQRIRGLDGGLQVRLNQMGIVRFSQIAGWSHADVRRVSQSLGFNGRIEQENWIEQAQILAKGGDTEYSRKHRLAATGQASTATAVAAATATAAASAAAGYLASQSAGPDRLTRIIGIDPEIEKQLIANGVSRYADIAHWSPAEAGRIEGLIGRPGRVSSDNWIDQARVLARFGEADLARPARLADAIRDNAVKPAESEAAPSRPDLSGLRSVRSEALRGDVLRPTGDANDLKRIRGVGVLIEKKLNSLGIMTYEQVANWTGADIDRISQILDFKGRIERENWVEQSRILASGGQTEFSRRVDRGDVEPSRDPKV